jgi:hypothetical protein
MAGQQIAQGVVADDVTVEHEEQAFLVVLTEDVFSQFEGTGSAKGFGLLGVGDLDVVLVLEGLEGLLDVVGLVVDGDDNFDNSNFGEGLRVNGGTSIWCSTMGWLAKGKVDLG